MSNRLQVTTEQCLDDVMRPMQDHDTDIGEGKDSLLKRV